MYAMIIYSQDIEIEFGIENEKRQTTPDERNGTVKSRQD